MKKNMKYVKYQVLLLSVLVAAACVKVDTSDITPPEPDGPGKININGDWLGDYPGSNFNVHVGGDDAQDVKPGDNILDGLYEPGHYNIYIYNDADQITVSGTDGNMSATVTGVSTPEGETGDFIEPMPGWFFSSATKESIEKDKVNGIAPDIRPQTRELNLLIEPTGGTIDRIADIGGSLSGVAGALSLDTGEPIGDPKKVSVTFTEITSGENAGKYIATVRLLDVLGDTQKLRITVRYNDGTPPDQLEEYELNALLSGFANDKPTPLTLGAQIVETPTAPTTSPEVEFTATISNWTVITDSIEVN